MLWCAAPMEHGTLHTLIPPAELKQLLQRSDARGLARLLGHLLAIAGTLALYVLALRERHAVWILPASICYGFTLVTMFSAMHECVHRTAFKSAWLNAAVGWF